MPDAAITTNASAFYAALGWEIRMARCNRRLSQRQVANMLGIDPSVYCRIESGQRTIDAVRFGDILRVLGPVAIPKFRRP